MKDETSSKEHEAPGLRFPTDFKNSSEPIFENLPQCAQREPFYISVPIKPFYMTKQTVTKDIVRRKAMYVGWNGIHQYWKVTWMLNNG